jgi:hypothetical protein
MPMTYSVELVERLILRREPGWVYFLRESEVWRARGGASERVASCSFTRAEGYQYNLNKEGNVTRVRKRLADAIQAGWPASGDFHALADGVEVPLRFGASARLGRVESAVSLPTGSLFIMDPILGSDPPWSAHLSVPAGTHRAILTTAVFHAGGERRVLCTHASILFSEIPEALRTLWSAEDTEHALGDYSSIAVDSGTLLLVDASEAPASDELGRQYGRAISEGIDPPTGLGLIPGVGDGFYPIVLGYDVERRLVRLHLDFLITPPTSPWAGLRWM